MKEKRQLAETLEGLAGSINDINAHFLNVAHQQVNTAMTIRNWLIGYYIVEYEQLGKDRAKYGAGLLKALAKRLVDRGVKSLQERNLYLCRDFYRAYPQILQTASAKLYLADFEPARMWQTPSATSTKKEGQVPDLNILLTQLSFSHFIEILKADTEPKRRFYEAQALKNRWPVRVLKRAVDSLLYERTGLSNAKTNVLDDFKSQEPIEPEAVFRNTYLLEFLGLEERITFSESELEERIITHLQNFLLELGRGFCFEARQKRLTFGNKHYRLDLVFYHRVLKCHVLLDLKIGEFDHADAGQMNMYLNYYKENESEPTDNPPVGIILCSGKNEALVRYATMGLPQQVFVSKYLVRLPTEKELQMIVEEERDKLQPE
ncbi:PDDEXK nuclease domain-containing protein [Flavihumibacter sediminis]|nr:PDDEXK nuclease domain-containing protein [Flavihumibacter sediminis]